MVPPSTNTRRAVIITPGQTTPVALTLSPAPRVAARVPHSDLVLVLGGTTRAPKLDLVDARAHTVTTLDPGATFNQAQVSPEGRFAVLLSTAQSGAAGLTARNLNEIGLVDLATPAVTRLQLDTESLAPRAVLFGPQETNRRLVAVSLQRGVALFDALHPTVAPRRISLQAPGTPVEHAVQQAVFSADAHWLFIRAQGLDDVVAVELGPEIGSPVAASLNFVSGGVGLSDIAAPPADTVDAVLAVFGTSREVLVLDAHGIQDRNRRLALPMAANHVRGLSGHRVLLWGDGSPIIAAWDLADGRSGAATLDGTFVAPTVVPALDRAIFAHASTSSASGGGPALSVVTVEQDTNRLRLHLQGLQLSATLTAATVDEAERRLFFSAASGWALVTLDLETVALSEIALESAITGLATVPEGDWVVAQAASGAWGDLTFLPAGATDRTLARRYTDFAFTGDLDHAGDAP